VHSMRIMRRLSSTCRSLMADDRGEDAVEYGLVVALVSLATVTAAFQLGLSLDAIWLGLYKIVVSLAGGG